MKYFKDQSGTVFAFEADGSQDAYIGADLTPITEAEADTLRAPPPELWAQAKDRALLLLRGERAPILTVLDGLQGTEASKGLAALLASDNAAATTHSTKAQQIETLKQGLKDAPTAIDFASCATFEEMRLAGKTYYWNLVQGASPDIITAFREVV